MKFVNKCFIRKNTQELLDLLQDIGYKICPCCDFPNSVWLETDPEAGEVHGIGYSDETYPVPVDEQLDLFLREESKGYIDCKEFEGMFIALSAYREDTEDKQVFTNDKGDFFVKMKDGVEFLTIPNCSDLESYHKATIEELKNLFCRE